MIAHLTSALSQTWPPFVLIIGLLLIGAVANADGLFEAAGGALARLPGGGLPLFLCLLGLVAVVTVVLNLDTSVVFLTPILLHAARRRGLEETAFLYGAVFMSNAASLLLPGSNLTNLLVLSREHVSGTHFAASLFPAWAASVVVTALVLCWWRRHDLRGSVSRDREPTHPSIGPGLVGIIGATVLVLVLAAPALPVMGVGVAVALAQVVRHRISPGIVARTLNTPVLAGIFVLAVALGVLARSWSGPADLIASIGIWPTAGVGAGFAAAVNNLPGAMLLSSRPPLHPRALLIGLDLGPNLVMTGSLSGLYWARVARATGAVPSARTYSRIGIFLVPLSMVAALAALVVSAGPHT